MIDALFVYGTLAPGKANGHFLKPLPGHWQSAWTYGLLYPKGIGLTLGYPAVDISGEDKIEGLLFTSKQLADLWPVLDEFEGEGYCRTAVTIYLTADQQPRQAYIYALTTPVDSV